ncbi:MAG: electron transfer flavoprotein subunit beta/FixA family protein [Candidatus Marisimplicoccus sp.]
MKILVCISNVPDTTSKINFVENDTKFDKNSVQFVINPNDEFGLTKAVWMKESHNANVTVITVGDQSTEPTLRKCLAIGADKAIRIDCNAKDGFSVAREITHFCQKEKFDLIICGRESIDYNGAIVPGVIAGILDYNFITNCVNLDIKGNNVEASREIDGGVEILECNLPIVLGAQKGLVEESDLIIPNMRGIMMARQKPLEVIEAQNFEPESENKTYHKPEAKKEVKLVKADEVDKLIDLLENEAKVI